MYYFIRHGIVFLIFAVVYSCSLLPDQLKTAEELMETAPDSALHILQKISPDKYKSSESKALYGLLLMNALDKNYLPLQPDSLLDFSIEYYEKHGDNDRLAGCYLFKGRMRKYAFQYENAMTYYLKALDVAAGSQDYLLLGKLNSDLGDIYNTQREYALARHKYFLSYQYYLKAHTPQYVYFPVLGMGRTHNTAKEFNKALYYYKHVYRHAKDSVTLGLAAQEIGTSYYQSNRYDSALHYLRASIHYPYVKNHRAIRHYYLADLYYDLKQLDSAMLYAQTSFDFNPDIRTQRECYRILTNAQYAKGNMPAMSSYMRKYVLLTDSLRKIDAQTKGSVLETLHTSSIQMAETKYKLWNLVLITVLVIFFGSWIYSSFHARSKQIKMRLEGEKYRLESEKIRLEDEKSHAEKLHERLKSSRDEAILKHQQALFQKIIAKKEAQQAERRKASPDTRLALDMKIYEELLHLNDKEYFYSEMNAVLNNLVTKLQSRYSGITEKEITWCCLHLLQIPVTDIYLLLDYKVESLNKMKQRFASKTGLPGAGEIKYLLNSLLLEE